MSTISAAVSTGVVSTPTSAASAAEATSTQFLELLMTQLQNQNPLDPTDPSEFTSQLVQYAGLEQQITTNDQIAAISDQLSSVLTTVSLLASGATA